MPTINVEMMKQLLQEFSEKEVLTGEEIKVIEQQIGELESRVINCRDRLQNLNEDKERLTSMMNRYVGAVGQAKTSSGKNKSIPKIADNPSTTENRSAANTSEIAAAAPADAPLAENLNPVTATDQDQNEMTNKDASKDASGDDAIKSINDALKGLFRK